jgi:23S rRNA (pseudouridine1915-N3)-methyltransferase
LTWRILAVGKPSLEFARLGIEDYSHRLAAFAKVEIHFVKPRADAADKLLELSAGCHRIILDETGTSFSSRAFAGEIQRLRVRGTSRLALLVGGSDGWSDAVRQQAGLLWSLGPQTLQHELALLVALEQVYRAETLLAGRPYHRD